MNEITSKSSRLKKSIILFTVFIDATGYAMIIPLLPFISATFGVGAAGLGLLMLVFALMQFIFSPIMGNLSDRYGRRKLLIGSIGLSSLSFLMFTIATSYWFLLISRILSGMATEISIAQAYMADITSNKKRTSGLGKVRAAFSAGVIIGPVIGGALSFIGYWAAGLLAVGLTLINLVFASAFLPETVISNNRNKISEKKEAESKITLFKKALHKPVIPLLLITFFMVNYAFAAIPILVPYVTDEFFGFTEFDLSLVFVFIGVLQFLIQGFLMDKLSEYVGEILLIAVGIIFITFGIALMPFLPSILFFYILISILSTGSGFMRTSVPGLISKISKEEEQGKYMGLAQSAASLALIPGPLIAGLTYEYVSFEAPFIISSILVFLTLFLIVKVYFDLKNRK
ncbi:MAG: MFS transporter [Candidatus Lokiarchaeota archaeon]|nr:MFS transporter [Candidatus Lokiarchaeota archaeon]MBD3202615.1 MFS transporter [Candidatus Lokiarchaeota archaeon]